MLFDIRSQTKAIEILERLTGVTQTWWIVDNYKNINRIIFTDSDQDIIRLLSKYNGSLPRYSDLELVISHITTSANQCQDILNNGILDLKGSYKNKTSELRGFFDNHGVEILVDSFCLKHNGKYYDISYEECPLNEVQISV